MKHIKHLVIQQKGTEDGGSVETVSSAVIAALYNLSKDEQLVYDQNDLKGDLQCTATYQRYIDALHTQYPNLNITATSTYFYFEDPVMQEYWGQSSYGDGVGITDLSVRTVINWPQGTHTNPDIAQFATNTELSSFNELNSFEALNYIPNACFYGCSNLTSVGLNNIVTINPQAFEESKLTEIINIPKFKSWGSRTTYNTIYNQEGRQFRNCSYITEINLGNSVDNLQKINSIPSGAFAGCSSLTKITGLNNISTISSQAFNDCTNLASLPDLNPNITSINYNAFTNCTSLLCIDVRNASLGNQALNGCTSLISLATNNVNDVGNYKAYTLSQASFPNDCFLRCPLTDNEITMPNCTSLNRCFQGTKIKKFKGVNVTTLGSSFENCTSLEEVEVGNLTSFGSNMVRGCTSLKTLKCGGFTYTYNTTSDLIEINCPNILTVGENCFMNCSQLYVTYTLTYEDNGQNVTVTKPVHLKLPEVISISTGGLAPIAIRELSIPKATSLGRGAFNSMTNLQRIHLSSDLTSIPNYCFEMCTGLIEMTIPATVTEIGSAAFNGCNSLPYIVFEGTTPPTVQNNTFQLNYNTPKQIFYVPDAAVEDYKTAWGAVREQYVTGIKPISQKPS